MCKAFSCLITKSKKVYWKTGVDGHDELQVLFVKKDKELKDDKNPPKNTFARIEINPKDGNYLNLNQKWVYKIDEKVKPTWLDKSYEAPCYKAFRLWKKEVYSRFNYKEALKPIHPFKIKPPKNITTRHLKLLAKWDSIGVSVWDSVRDSSIGVSVWDSVWDSVGDSVRDSSIGVSVWDSVGAYGGSLFKGIKKWKYVNCKKLGIKGYPFASVVKLWKMGLVPSFDGEKWRLHGGKDGGIMWTGTKEDLKKYL